MGRIQQREGESVECNLLFSTVKEGWGVLLGPPDPEPRRLAEIYVTFSSEDPERGKGGLWRLKGSFLHVKGKGTREAGRCRDRVLAKEKTRALGRIGGCVYVEGTIDCAVS